MENPDSKKAILSLGFPNPVFMCLLLIPMDFSKFLSSLKRSHLQLGHPNPTYILLGGYPLDKMMACGPLHKTESKLITMKSWIEVSHGHAFDLFLFGLLKLV